MEPFVVVDGFEKAIRDVDRDIEVDQRDLVVLGVDETQNVRVGHTHHAHIGAATYATLLDHIRYLIDDAHERYWTGCVAAGGVDDRASGAQEFVTHAGATARLVNDGRGLGMLHDAFD